MSGEKAGRRQDYVEHILGAIERIEAYVSDVDQSGFMSSTLVQDAIIRNFEVIGEAANKIRSVDPSFLQRYPDVRLDLAYRMRNALIHGYESVNLSVVWNTIQSDVPILKQQMNSLLRDGGLHQG